MPRPLPLRLRGVDMKEGNKSSGQRLVESALE